MQLDARLMEIADMTQQGSIVADIGTDHGYLITELVRSGKAPSGFACDINKKPLQKAAEIIAAYGLENKITCVLCSGLDGILPSSVDTIVIAGMGGSLIAEIIGAAPWLKNPNKHLLLQPMTKSDLLREYLASNGFQIICENAVCSRRFAYTVFSVRYSGTTWQLTELQKLIGRVVEGATADTPQYLERVKNALTIRAEGFERSANSAHEAQKYRALLAELDEVIRGCSHERKQNM